MTDHSDLADRADLAGESPGPDLEPGQGGRRWFARTVLVVLLVTGRVAAGAPLLLLAVYIGRSRQEPAPPAT